MASKIFDLVYFCHEKDKEALRKNITFARKNVLGMTSSPH